MRSDQLIKILQDWTNKIPLIVLGSGSSSTYGIPSMNELGKHLVNTLTFPDTKDQRHFDSFKKNLKKTGNLEVSLSNFPINAVALRAILSETWSLINAHDIKAFEDVIAKRSEFALFDLIRYLLTTSRRKVNIVTTNYDRIAEYAAGLSNAAVCTGFSANYIGQLSPDISLNALSTLKGYNGQVNIWKVHGSLDWFKTSDDINISLPLQQRIPEGFQPCIVTPGITKYEQALSEPYRTIFSKADEEISHANGFLCIGYGFNDKHVHPKLIEQIKSGKPIIVLSRTLTDNLKQSIIDGKCRNYCLIEKAGSDSKIFASFLPKEQIIKNTKYWSLEYFLKLIK